jgi:secondary thiamine-phosphate synthase enzyme
MKIKTSYINLNSKGRTDIINITDAVDKELSKTGLCDGTVLIFAVGSTAGIATVEYEPALVSDVKELFEKLIPSDVAYRHDATWGDANGYSHLRASLLGPSLPVPFSGKKLLLGRWQQIIFADFDNRPRSRQIVLQFIGE